MDERLAFGPNSLPPGATAELRAAAGEAPEPVAREEEPFAGHLEGGHRPASGVPGADEARQLSAGGLEPPVVTGDVAREASGGGQEASSAEPPSEGRAAADPRVESATAMAAALADVARAVEGGQLDASRAADAAGIAIRPPDGATWRPPGGAGGRSPANNVEGHSASPVGDAAGGDGDVAEQPSGRLPPEEKDESDDMLEEREGSTWLDAPPRGFKREVSLFGETWMALEEWVSADTVAFLSGARAANGGGGGGQMEYRRRAVAPNGKSAQITRTFSECVARALPDVAQSLHLSVALSTLQQAMGKLVRTFSFESALPPFGMPRWRLLALLLLDALSAHQLPAVSEQLRGRGHVLSQVVASLGVSMDEYKVFRDLLLPAGPSL